MNYQSHIDMAKGALFSGVVTSGIGMFVAAFGGERHRSLGAIIFSLGSLNFVGALIYGALVLAMEIYLT